MNHTTLRANIVCIQCHNRKVKCDLKDAPGDICKNCRRLNHTCVRRDGVRKRRRLSRREEKQSQPSTSLGEFVIETNKDQERALGSLSPLHRLSPGECNHPEPTKPVTKRYEGFIAGHSVLSCDEPTPPTMSDETQSESSQVKDAILRVTQATILPKPFQLRALTDAYFEHIFHQYPIVNRKDVYTPGSSVLLQQAVCLAGSLMRHAPDSSKLSRSLYEKVKMLLTLNIEHDSLPTLQTICLLSCWSIVPPDQISIDGPWHWTGVATRLALQMGLHKESTYANRENAGCLRRIFWHLHNGDKLQSAVWGRPSALKPKDFDVRLPTLDDFEVSNIQASIFLQSTRLCIIIGEIAECCMEKRPISSEEVSRLAAVLCDWLRNVPDELRLYDSDGVRRDFHRPTSELFIKYFASIILVQMAFKEKHKQWRTSILSLIASSCIVRLYEEIHYREQTAYLLPIHGFLCMTAALPQIHYRPQSSEKEELRKGEINTLWSIMIGMRGTYGGSDMILGKMQALQNKVERLMRRNPFPSETEELCPIPNPLGAWQPQEYVSQLFPFPTSICSNMDLLELAATQSNELTTKTSLLAENELINWHLDEPCSFMNMFGVDLNGFDIMGDMNMST